MGRGIGQLVGGSRPDTEDKVRIEEWITPDDLGTTGALYNHVRDGRLRVGDTLRYQDAATGLTHTAEVTATGHLGFDGHEYDDPSAPLIEKCGRTRNGWRDWRLSDGRSLRDLGVQAHSS